MIHEEITAAQIDQNEHLLNHVARADLELLRRLQCGAIAPASLDVDALCQRVDMWMEHRLIQCVEAGNIWWVFTLAELVITAWRRKHTAAIAKGDWLRATFAAGGAFMAFLALGVLSLRCLTGMLSPHSLRPVLRYTAA